MSKRRQNPDWHRVMVAPPRTKEWLEERGWKGRMTSVAALDAHPRCLVGFFTDAPCWDERVEGTWYCSLHLWEARKHGRSEESCRAHSGHDAEPEDE